ncbi:basic proline-rich protein-like [Muntiacus reevesi]|uniref:basic proline-rich protein-like n=1 Tax=Muntiacus reevesi TaxID=9886 RepID=UPI0033072787
MVKIPQSKAGRQGGFPADVDLRRQTPGWLRGRCVRPLPPLGAGVRTEGSGRRLQEAASGGRQRARESRVLPAVQPVPREGPVPEGRRRPSPCPPLAPGEDGTSPPPGKAPRGKRPPWAPGSRSPPETTPRGSGPRPPGHGRQISPLVSLGKHQTRACPRGGPADQPGWTPLLAARRPGPPAPSPAGPPSSLREGQDPLLRARLDPPPRCAKVGTPCPEPGSTPLLAARRPGPPAPSPAGPPSSLREGRDPPPRARLDPGLGRALLGRAGQRGARSREGASGPWDAPAGSALRTTGSLLRSLPRDALLQGPQRAPGFQPPSGLDVDGW